MPDPAIKSKSDDVLLVMWYRTNAVCQLTVEDIAFVIAGATIEYNTKTDGGQ